jgi:hypothetical protein
MVSEKLINLEECAHVKNMWEALESQFRKISVSFFMAYFLRLFGVRQQLEKYIKIENYYSIIKQFIRDLKKFIDKFPDINDIYIYFIFEWAEYEYQSIKISKFKESEIISTAEEVYGILYDNRNFFQISNSIKVLKLDIRSSKSFTAFNTIINIMKINKKRKRRAKSFDENIGENIKISNKANKRKKNDIYDKQTVQISISINRVCDDCDFTYNKKGDICFYIYSNQTSFWWNK